MTTTMTGSGRGGAAGKSWLPMMMIANTTTSVATTKMAIAADCDCVIFQK
jgi:hypothetical protein